MTAWKIKFMTLQTKKWINLSAITGFMLFIIFLSMNRSNQLQTQINTYQQQTLQKNRLLSSLHSQLGYGGMIHFFKNYVLRGELQYYNQFNEVVEEINNTLSKFRAHSLNRTELSALTSIQLMTDDYTQAVASTLKLWQKGKTSNEVLVKLQSVESIRTSLGYGGMIHQFKNYVLRGHDKYATAFTQQIKLVNSSLQDYRSSGEMSVKETQSLEKLSEMLTAYSNAMETAKGLWTQGKSAQEVISKLELVEEINSQMGYGGAIHAFKNYVLRGDKKYLSQFQQHRKRILKALNYYRSLGNLSAEERESLNKINEMIERYSNTIFVTKGLWQSNKPINEAQIKIDDTAYLTAFITLRRVFRQATQARNDIDTRIKINDKPYLLALKNLGSISEQATKARKTIDEQIQVDDQTYFFQLNLLQEQINKENELSQQRILKHLSNTSFIIIIFILLFGIILLMMNHQLINYVINQVLLWQQVMADHSKTPSINQNDEFSTLGKSILARQSHIIQQQQARDEETQNLLKKNSHCLHTIKIFQLTHRHTDDLAKQLLTYLADIFQAQSLILYKIHSENIPLSIASYGSSNDEQIEGQGLVIQVAKDGEVKRIENIPDDSLIIRTGLIKATAKFISIIPIILNGQVHSVLEIASLNPIDHDIEKLIETTGEAIAMALGKTDE